MFFVLSKILYFLITPIVWMFALLLAGLIVKRQPLKKRLLLGSFIVFAFFSNDFIANECMKTWEIGAVQDSTLQPKYDVAIILGGMVEYDASYKRVQFEHGSDRLFQAVRLYKQGRVKKLLLDGGAGDLYATTIEAPVIKKYLIQIGIPDSVILIEPRSRNTHENAMFVKPILDSAAPHGSYLLVTSGYHMRRAMGCFAKAGIPVTPYSADRIAGPLRFQLDYLLLPDVDSLYNWEILLHEWVGYISYKIAGYI
jgi:uncharacterized SAM-binding protein YcdF (DUF218 family)